MPAFDPAKEVAARAEALALTPSRYVPFCLAMGKLDGGHTRYVPFCLAMGKLDGGHTRVYLDNA